MILCRKLGLESREKIVLVTVKIFFIRIKSLPHTQDKRNEHVQISLDLFQGSQLSFDHLVECCGNRKRRGGGYRREVVVGCDGSELFFRSSDFFLSISDQDLEERRQRPPVNLASQLLRLNLVELDEITL